MGHWGVLYLERCGHAQGWFADQIVIERSMVDNPKKMGVGLFALHFPSIYNAVVGDDLGR
ncbi:MAG: hypothetical protein KIS91_05980 [Anaerolineae bacterium]|nr:hypothetical protein [Anaerolineae bacterium]